VASSDRGQREHAGVELPAVADFISLPFYDLFAENGHVPKVRENLPALLTGVRRRILEVGAGTGLITTSLAEWTTRHGTCLSANW
jgi:ubiquinone/menaquinone biosynthesis C-methylase UbiE